MIISCPSCDTRFDMPASRSIPDGAMVKCSACGHSWLEARAIELPAIAKHALPAVIDYGFEPDMEIRRLVEANRDAEEAFAQRRRQKNKRLTGWAALAAAVTLPLIAAAAFPETIVAAAPATVAAYQAIGKQVNIYGLDLRRIELQHMVVDGTRVLAIKGEIANISGSEQRIPWIRFGLRDTGNAEIYNWTLDAGARPLRPGEITNFVTRVASPPEMAKNVEIRFAHRNEIQAYTGL